MALKKWRSHRHKSDGKKRHRELSARLAPLEETKEFRRSEQRDGGDGGAGTIRVDRKSVKMPEQLIAEERDAADTFRPHPVVVVILLIALAFIAFIAWQITLMPPPAK
jgi:hypothetical protein